MVFDDEVRVRLGTLHALLNDREGSNLMTRHAEGVADSGVPEQTCTSQISNLELLTLGRNFEI